MNNVNIIGNLTKNPELRYTPQGTAVATLGIAINEVYKETKTVHFFNIECWGKIAETCNQYLTKGSKVGVEGSLKQHRWQTQEGQNRSVVLIRANRVEFLSTKPKSEEPEEEKVDME